MRQRYQQQHRQRQHQQRRHAHVARAAQTQAAAEIEAVEELVAGGEPQQLHADCDRGGRVRIVRAGEGGQDPRPAERNHHADRTHVERREQDHAITHRQRPVARARTDRLANERGARTGDTEAGHVGDRGEDRDDLRRRAADCPEPRLHHLEDRVAEQVGRRRQPHRHAEPQLLEQPAGVQAPGEVRLYLRR